MSGLRWTAGARMAAQLITWAITLVVIRILSPADYGLLAMATVFVAFLMMLSDVGLGSAIVQRTEVELPVLRKVFGVVVVVHLFAALLLVLCAPLIASFFGEPRVVPIVQVLALQFVIVAWAVIPNAILQRRMEFRQRSMLDLSAAIVGSASTLGLALAGQGVWALVIGSLLTQTWKTIGLNCISPFWHRPSFDLHGLRGLLKFGTHITGSEILWFFFTQIDMVIAGRWLGKELVGFYAVAMHVASLPNQRIAGIINQVAFPAFARIQDDVGAVGRHLLSGVRILSFFAFPILWGISSTAPEIVPVVLGPKWSVSIVPLQLIGLVMPLRIINNFIPNAVRGIGRSDILLKNAIIASLVMPTAFLIGVNWGLVGLSVAWLVAAPLVFLQSSLSSLPALSLRLGRLANAMAPAAFAGALMYGAVDVMRPLLPIEQWAIFRLSALVSTGVIAYAIASFALNRSGIREVIVLIRGIATTRHA